MVSYSFGDLICYLMLSVFPTRGGSPYYPSTSTATDFYDDFENYPEAGISRQESIYDLRNRNFAEVARANKKLKFLKWEYKLAKKCRKNELKARIFETFKNLI